ASGYKAWPSAKRPLSIRSFRRPRVHPAACFAAVAAALSLLLWITEAADAQQPPVQGPPADVVLAPHRASYEMKLSVARPNSGIVEVTGNMVIETVDSCDGWNVKQRIKLT